jgi:DNA repair protein RecO (recombination protein O)
VLCELSVDRFVAQAFVLSTLDYGDADRVVTLFTRDRGRLTAFAAGARKSKRRFSGALEPFTLIDAHLVERRGDTFRIDDANIQRGFYGIRRELGSIARAMYAVELCRELTRDHEAHPELFAGLSGYLETLDAGGADESTLFAFELNALAQAGLQPRFSECASCGGALGAAPGFDAELGGAACFGCRPRRPGPPAPAELLVSLGALQRGERVSFEAQRRRQARALLDHFISHHLGRMLKSAGFMAQLGLE